MGNHPSQRARVCYGRTLGESSAIPVEYQFHPLFALAFIATLVCANCQHSYAADSLVGVAGDVTAAEVQGCRQVPAEELRHALLVDTPVELACAPSSPLDIFIETVQRTSQEDYLGDGFADSQVKAGLDPSGQHLLIHVFEGPQYTAGNVEIVGASLVDTKALVSALTQPGMQAPADTVIGESAGTMLIPTWKESELAQIPWEIGKPAHLSTQDLDACRDQTLKALLNQGFFWADINVQPELRGDRTAVLVVHIVKEGPKAGLSAIRISGLAINTQQDVLAYAGLTLGMPIDLQFLRSVREKFWNSGRFFRHDIRANWSRANPGKIALELDFWEHPNLPPLNTPIPVDSPQGIMLRMALTVQESMARGDAFIVKLNNGRQHLRIAMQSNRGFSLHWLRDASNTSPSTEPATFGHYLIDIPQPPQSLDLALIARPNRIDLFSATARRRFTLREKMLLSINLEIVPDPTDKEHPFSINFGAGFNMDPMEGQPPVRLDFSLAPVACLDCVTPRSGPSSPPRKIELRNGILQVDYKFGSFRVDAASGRLINWSSESSEFEFEQGALDREIKTDAMPRSMANDYDPRHPVSSLVGFLAACNSSGPFFLWGTPERTRVMVHFISILAGPALESLDRGIAESTDADDDFDDARRYVDSDSPMTWALAWAGYANYVFEYGTWPWTISREAMLALGGGSPDAQSELVRVVNSDATGPIGFVALSAAMRPSSLVTAQAMASIGLDHLSADEFEHDVHILLKGPGIGPKTLSTLMQAVSDLSNDEFSVLSTAIPSNWVEVMNGVRQVGKTHPGQPVVDALAQSTDKWWNGSMRKIVKAELDHESDSALSSDQTGK
jgi:hypothetical protein